MEKKTKSQASENWVAVGKPLSWSDAGFLKHEMEAAGLHTQIKFTSEQEKDPHAKVQVIVAPEDLPAGKKVRQACLEHPNGSEKPSKTSTRIKAGLGAIFGIVMGLRVGEHVTKNPIGILFFAIGLGAIAYFGIQGIWPGKDS